jgi:toxin HigB-1
LTKADILATSRWVWRRLTELAPVSGSRHAVETSGGRWRGAPRYRPCRASFWERRGGRLVPRQWGRHSAKLSRPLITCCVNNVSRYHRGVLRSFRDKDTEAIWHRQQSRRLDGPVQRVAWRKLAMLDAAETLTDLLVPPGNRLEKLTGDRAGQYSIRIGQQWRICFVWTDAGPDDVEIVDYH